MTKPSPTVSDSNHELLLTVQGQLSGLAKSVETFTERQGEENKRIHERIDATRDTMARAVDSLKDLLNARGRVSGSFILSLAAVILSSLAILSGFGASFVTMRLDAVKPDIMAQGEAVRNLTERMAAADRILAKAEGWREANEAATRRELDRLHGLGKGGE